MDFKLLHGECVFIGMILAAIISYQKNIISKSDLDLISSTIKLFNIPQLPDDLDINSIISYTKNDKKVEGNSIKFILINKIGEAYIDLNVSDTDMLKALNEYMQN